MSNESESTKHFQIRRSHVTDQLSYLLLELDAIARIIYKVPAEILSMRPAGRWSIKEVFGHLADCDRHIFYPRLQAMVRIAHPIFENVDQDKLLADHNWNEREPAQIFQTIRKERTKLVDFLASLSNEEWLRDATFPDGEKRSILELALFIARHDTHHLKSIAVLLHESNLSDRPSGVPR